MSPPKSKCPVSNSLAHFLMRHLAVAFTCLHLLAFSPAGYSGDMPRDTDLQAGINQKYRNYFGPDSQMLLPFKTVEVAEWKKIRAEQKARTVYTEPDKFYNGKVYTLTLYQVGDHYFLDAKGGFWGMDELVYGPISADELKPDSP